MCISKLITIVTIAVALASQDPIQSEQITAHQEVIKTDIDIAREKKAEEEKRKAEEEKKRKEALAKQQAEKEALARATTKKSNANNSYSQSDLTLLMRVVESETFGSGYKEKTYVIDTILNRIESDKFPNTLRGVLTQKSQFANPFNGTISEETKQAVADMLKNRGCSRGATMFLNKAKVRSSVVSSWERNYKYLFTDKINHSFYKN